MLTDCRQSRLRTPVDANRFPSAIQAIKFPQDPNWGGDPPLDSLFPCALGREQEASTVQPNEAMAAEAVICQQGQLRRSFFTDRLTDRMVPSVVLTRSDSTNHNHADS